MANLKANGTEIVRLERYSVPDANDPDDDGTVAKRRTELSVRSNGVVLSKLTVWFKQRYGSRAGQYVPHNYGWKRMGKLKQTDEAFIATFIEKREAMGYRQVVS